MVFTVLREVQDATRLAQSRTGLAAVHSYAQCSVKLMSLARALERPPRSGDAPPADGSTAEDMWARAASYWKQHAANAADNSEEYLLSSSCYKLAAACNMRAHRMRQQKGKGSSEKAAAQRAAEEAMQLGAEVTALVKAATSGRASANGGGAPPSSSSSSGVVTLNAEQGAKVEAALHQLAGLSRALSDYETGVGLAKAFASSAPKHVRARAPTLDNFAVISSGELINVGQGLVNLTLEMAESAAAEAAAGGGGEHGGE